MILLIDNYDSFTYNLYQYVGTINENIRVIRNDKITCDEIEDLNPSHIIISPGPGYPKDAGISIEVIQRFHKSIPILGVCLGHQSIGAAFGSEIVHAERLFHGKASNILLGQSALFEGLPEVIKGARYHSLIIDKGTLSSELKTIAATEAGEIMAVQHEKYPVFGIQFHPESIITEHGLEMIKNFLNITGKDYN